ncbi:MAG: hypothetical protein AAGE89_18055 [Pseudomonadota bacterium]
MTQFRNKEDLFCANGTNIVPLAGPVGQDKVSKRRRFLPMAKHAGFTGTLASIAGTLTAKISAAYARRQDRLIVQSLLSSSDEVLRDMALTRGDLTYVLSTKSPLLATERLKLIRAERRAESTAAALHRQDALLALIPAPFGNGKRSIGKESAGT